MQQQSSSTSPASADTSFDLFYGRLKMTAPRFQVEYPYFLPAALIKVEGLSYWNDNSTLFYDAK
jgi:hypothetical protein